MLTAITVNVAILMGATAILTTVNQEARMFGIGTTNLYLLMLAIPVNTWVNFLFIICCQKLITKQ